MTEPEPFARPGTTPTPRRRRPAFAGPRDEFDVPPLDHIAPILDPPWSKEGTETPDRTAAYYHPDGHRIGIRVQPRGLAIQTWITAGPDLPPIPDGTDTEQAEAQAANDARLQPGRTWHRAVAPRHTDNLRKAIESVLRDGLIPALTNKPKRIHTVTYPGLTPKPEPQAPTEQQDTVNKKESQK